MTVDAELFGDVLPTYLTRFIGRDAENTELSELLRPPGVVTICGVGGAGKTRLAVEVARRVGAEENLRLVWVPLASTLDSGGVGSAIAHGLGLAGLANLDQLGAALAAGRVLLVLDNCEHVAQGCRDLLARLLPQCGDLRVLTTTRAPLGIAVEQIYGLPPLGGTVVDDGGATDAVALFVDRAAGVAAGYALTELNRPVLAAICRTLHGSPLAIELAASWIRVLSPRDLLASLTQAHATVGSVAAPFVEERHCSIQAVLDSSWQWLGSSDRAVIEALGVFVGGFTKDAAEAVAGADLATLSRLSQLALIQRLPDPYGGSRYQVHELVRAYALDRLADHPAARSRHLAYFVGLVETTGAFRNTPFAPTWSDPIAGDLANVDAALVWALNCGDAESAQRLAVGLDHFWLFCLHSYEHRVGRLEAALALPGDPASDRATHARAQALLNLGLRDFVTDPARSRSRFGEAGRLFEQVGDAAGVAACIRGRGNARLLQGDNQGCRRDCFDSLARCRTCGDEQGVAWSLESIGAAFLLGGDLAGATVPLSQAAALFAAMDNPVGACYSEIELALSYQLSGKLLESADACRRALDHQRQNRLLATSADLLEAVARLCVELSRWTGAAQLYGAAASWHTEYDTVSWFPLVSRFSRAADVRRHLGESAWVDAYESGRRLAPARALDVAADELIVLRSDLRAVPAGLSTREIEVLQLVAAGCSDVDIAHQLVLSPRTIHAHLRSIYRKLEVGSRTAAVAAAGLVATPGPRRSLG